MPKPTKVVRAFSIDSDVARMIDKIAERNSTWDKKPNKSRTVNYALRWYYLSDIAEIIDMKDSEIDFWKARCANMEGGKGYLSKFLALFRKSD